MFNAFEASVSETENWKESEVLLKTRVFVNEKLWDHEPKGNFYLVLKWLFNCCLLKAWPILSIVRSEMIVIKKNKDVNVSLWF